ncbi:MAG: BatA and WFA domain-containing protein [Ignavibacteria bacterium]|nr:BatA and WFA domain-containing protein [Ignavibacteria bacterium]
MNFLNPSVLIGLFAVSIPILIHLLNLRKLKKVDFSTLMFLKEIQKSKMRRIKLKQLLLLALRIFVIAFLVLAFSKPVLENYSFGADAEGKSTVLIFLDDSFSMDAQDGNGRYFDQAKRSVAGILENYSESDEIILIPSSFTGYKNSAGITGGISEINDSLEFLNISYKPFKLNDAFVMSEQILKNSVNPNKDVFIISDFQTVNVDERSEIFKNKNAADVNYFFIRTGSRTVSNLSLDSLVVISKIPAKFGNIRMSANLTNHSENPVINKSLKLFIDGKLTEESVTDVNANSIAKKEFSFTADRTGDIHGYIELTSDNLQEDELIQDNRIYFDIFIPGIIRVGLIGNSGEFRFVNAALNSAQNLTADNNAENLFEIKYLNNFTDEIFDQDVLIVSPDQSFSVNDSKLISEFLAAGKGIFVFLNERTDIANFNSAVSSVLNIPVIENLNSDEMQNVNLKFGKIDFENPLMAEIFRNRQLNITSESFIDSPEIRKYFELIMNENSFPVISLSNNRPFISETELPKGKFLMSAVSAETGFSDFPLNNIFPPLIIRSVFYLNSDFGFTNENLIGRSNIIPVKGLNNVSGLNSPDGSSSDINYGISGPLEKFLIMPYSVNTASKGLYFLNDSAGNKFGFSLNSDPAESITSILSEEEIENVMSNFGLVNAVLINDINDISADINEKRTGTSLWKYFLLAALIFLALEIIYSKKLEE